jgi:hypothetical protein
VLGLNGLGLFELGLEPRRILDRDLHVPLIRVREVHRVEGCERCQIRRVVDVEEQIGGRQVEGRNRGDEAVIGMQGHDVPVRRFG